MLNFAVEIAALEARWSESATNDPDFLTVDEFLAFTHPEASPSKLIGAVQDTFNTFGTRRMPPFRMPNNCMRKGTEVQVQRQLISMILLLDLDGDGVITKTEFDTTYAEAEGVDPVYKEDLHLIDADRNKQISRVELMVNRAELKLR